jgi:uncharacterized membrane protein
MLTVSPFVATFTLVCWKPDRWGDTLNPLAILLMGYFGMLTFPGLFGYVLALVTAPVVMSAVSKQKAFTSLPLPALLSLAFLVGVVAGLCVMAPAIVRASSHGSLDLTLNWAASGAVSGGVTLAIIAIVYRKLAQ